MAGAELVLVACCGVLRPRLFATDDRTRDPARLMFASCDRTRLAVLYLRALGIAIGLEVSARLFR